jgi:ATP-dependent DNA helicase RecQ
MIGMSELLYPTLKQYFGYDEFRFPQKEIITDVLNKKDVFVLMPTGGGKSLCYQVPALMQEGLTVVISPLIALMKDQVDGLKQNGIKAEFFNSSLTSSEKDRVRDQLVKKKISLLYIAPERLMQDSFLEILQNLEVSLFAIDEAHCISEWGHDFRTEYRKLSKIKLLFPDIPVIALTATATPRVKEDILKQLHLDKASQYQASFNRTNLF